MVIAVQRCCNSPVRATIWPQRRLAIIVTVTPTLDRPIRPIRNEGNILLFQWGRRRGILAARGNTVPTVLHVLSNSRFPPAARPSATIGRGSLPIHFTSFRARYLSHTSASRIPVLGHRATRVHSPTEPAPATRATIPANQRAGTTEPKHRSLRAISRGPSPTTLVALLMRTARFPDHR